MVLYFRKPWLYPDFIYYMTSQGKTFKRHCDYVHTISENIIQSRMLALVGDVAACRPLNMHVQFLSTSLQYTTSYAVSYQFVSDLSYLLVYISMPSNRV